MSPTWAGLEVKPDGALLQGIHPTDCVSVTALGTLGPILWGLVIGTPRGWVSTAVCQGKASPAQLEDIHQFLMTKIVKYFKNFQSSSERVSTAYFCLESFRNVSPRK